MINIAKKKINIREIDGMKRLLSDLKLNTICTEALCPNISECHSKRQATFLILGKICTRNCSFCNVIKGRPAAVDNAEPLRIVEAVERLNLKHVVITSPTRDDLEDGGAEIYHKTISALRNSFNSLAIEVLIPDLKGSETDIKKIVSAGPDITGHNIETVERLYAIRNNFLSANLNTADYQRSLNVLKSIKKLSHEMKIKSALMLGLGEREEEVLKTIKDIFDTGCRYLSLGQYLAPAKRNYPVQEFINEEKFAKYKDAAVKMGFKHVESGPYVRSSYNAEKYYR